MKMRIQTVFIGFLFFASAISAEEDKVPDEQEPEEGPAAEELVATNWLNGVWLSENQLKTTPLYARKEEGLVTFNAGAIVDTIAPVVLPFEEQSDQQQSEDNECAASEENNPFYLLLRFCCPARQCEDGMAICFVGKMDPQNGINRHFELPNMEGALDPRCAKDQKALAIWKDKAVHSLTVKTTEGGKFEMKASFTQNGEHSLEPNSDGCIEFSVATKDSKIGMIEDANNTINFVGQTVQEFYGDLSNGLKLKELPIPSSLPLDLFSAGFNPTEPIFALAGSKGCQMTMKIDGLLKRCLDQSCNVSANAEDMANPAEEQRAYYRTEFELANLVPMLKPSDLPEQYKDGIFFEADKRTSKPRAVISTNGNEMVFSVLTKSDVPPALTIVRPPNDISCTVKFNFDVNEFVFAYNGRPDCYGRFAWGERHLRFRDEMGISTEVNRPQDMPLVVKNGDEFWTVDQFTDSVMLGRGTCPAQSRRLAKPMPGMPEHVFLWEFILNPKKNEYVPIVESSKCVMAMAVDLDEDRLLVSDVAKDEKKEEEGEV